MDRSDSEKQIEFFSTVLSQAIAVVEAGEEDVINKALQATTNYPAMWKEVK
jgi:hypothetical protein